MVLILSASPTRLTFIILSFTGGLSAIIVSLSWAAATATTGVDAFFKISNKSSNFFMRFKFFPQLKLSSTTDYIVGLNSKYFIYVVRKD